MTSFRFYFPSSNGDNDGLDDFMHRFWKEQKDGIDCILCVRRISMRGIPCIKGLIVANDSSTIKIPDEFEVQEIPEDGLVCIHNDFKEEQRVESNATEYGLFPSRS